METVKRKIVSYNINENLTEQLNLIAFIKNEKMSDIVEDLIRDYVTKNKSSLNEIALKINSNYYE